MYKFNRINNRDELADFLKVPRSKLTHILYVLEPDSLYKTFNIPKKSGGYRTICSPCEDLKSIQVKLADAIWEHENNNRLKKQSNLRISHGFEKEKGIISNACIHRNKRFVVNIDLQDFFPSIHFGRVLGFFRNNYNYQLPYEVAVIIAQLTCYNGCLPQGAPTSPIISNLIGTILDMQIIKLSKKYRFDYTRYADDLTFSTNWSHFLSVYQDFLKEIDSLIEESGFHINKKKTRLIFKDSRQEVTGLVVNDKINIKREYIKTTRAMAHTLYSNGEFHINNKPGSLAQLEGRFAFIDQLSHFNNRNDGKTHNSWHLSSREEDYKAFLFYKYFFGNVKPLIITEGKTDVLFLKAALKNQYNKYPELIEKDSTDSFRFKVSFFNRTNRWKYFYDLSMDGADALIKIAKHFIGYNNYNNYYSLFHEKYNCTQIEPVVLLFDNESTPNKPLKNIENTFKLSEEQVNSLQDNLYINLLTDSKLFLLTCPLINEKKESQIEDLLPEDVLSYVINGKKFSRNASFDTERYYGKSMLASYVYSNYKSIDFSKFTPLLKALSLIISTDK